MLKIIRYATIGILYAILLTPMLLSSRFFFPFISTKVFYFRLLVELAAALYVILAVSDPRLRPRRSPLMVAVLVFFCIVVITAVVGVNPYRSFWGNAERGEGILTLAHIIALFVVLAGMFRSARDWQRYFLGIFLAAVASAVYATLQKLGASFVFTQGGARVYALFGNAAFFAGYLLLNSYIGAWLFTVYTRLWQRMLIGFATLYLVAVMGMTQTRGALIGLGAGIFILLLLSVFMSRRRNMRTAGIAGIAVLVLASVLLWTMRESRVVTSVPILSRLASIRRDDITTESRLLTWQAAWQGWKDRFLIGYGYENFSVPFNRYFPARIFRDSGSQIWFDRAHNIVFDTATTSGLFGLLAYLAFYILSFRALFRHWMADPKRNGPAAAIFSAMLVSYFIQNLFVFDTLGTYTVFYAVLAFIAGLPYDVRRSENKVYIRPFSPLAVGASTLLFAAVSFYAVILPYQSNLSVMRGLVAASKNDVPGIISYYTAAIESGTYNSEEARQKLAEGALNARSASGVSEGQKDQVFRIAIEQMKQASVQAPYEARNYLYLMALYNNLPKPSEGSYEEVLRLGRKVTELSPTRPQTYFEMGQAALSLNRPDEGLGYFHKAVELNTFPVESHWNYAFALMLTGHDNEAGREMQYVYNNNIAIINSDNLAKLVRLYAGKGNYEATLPLYSELIRRQPDSYGYHAELALIYNKLCRVNEAKKELDAVLAINPKLSSDVERLNSLIGQGCGR